MGYSPYKGAGIRIPHNDVPHLFFVLNDPCKDGLCLLVMVSSIKDGRPYEEACVLDVGDHDFITHPSYIVYRIASQTRAAHIGNMVDKGYYKSDIDARSELLERVFQGLLASDEISGSMLRYAKSVWQ